MLAAFVFIQMDNHRSIQMDFRQQDNHFKQVEALFSLFAVIKPRYPLPPMDGWAITPDFANIIISHIFEHKPNIIFELSSGASTLIAAYCVEKNGKGKIFSLENYEESFESSKFENENEKYQSLCWRYCYCRNFTIWFN